MKKKGSLNLSIEAIVIIVIAMTLLGLGIGFVKGIIGDTVDLSKDTLAKTKERISDDLRTSGKKVSISPEILLERGKQKVETIGIANTDTVSSQFGIKITPLKKQNPDGSEGKLDDMTKEVSFFYNNLVDKKLSPTEADVISVTISAKSSAAGNYLYKVDVLKETKDSGCISLTVSSDCIIYDTKSFFVKVS